MQRAAFGVSSDAVSVLQKIHALSRVIFIQPVTDSELRAHFALRHSPLDIFKVRKLHLPFEKRVHKPLSRLIILDVNAPREEIEHAENDEDMEEMFAMDEEVAWSGSGTTKHPIGHTLDVCMQRMFEYVIGECHDPNTNEFLWENTKSTSTYYR